MSHRIFYRIINKGLIITLGLSAAAGVARAQRHPTAPTESDVYCSGLATTQAVPKDTYVISGENANDRIIYEQFDSVYINRGANQGVKVGDLFEVIRPVHEVVDVKWFDWQPELSRAMGTMYADVGRLRVINVLPKTSIAEVVLSCDAMQRGDIARPFTERSAPTYHATAFDRFAAPSGKKTAMVVLTKGYGQVAGVGTTVYVNLGSDQGVHVGDYFRIFQYQGTHHDTSYQTRDMSYKLYGFGSTPVAYHWDDVPRQVLGEGVVLRTGPNSATVLLTLAGKEVYVGDYVELE